MTSPASVASPFGRPSPISMASAMRQTQAQLTPGSSPSIPLHVYRPPLAGPSGAGSRAVSQGVNTPTPLRGGHVGGPSTRAGSVSGATGRSQQQTPADFERNLDAVLRERIGRLEKLVEEAMMGIDNAFSPSQDPSYAETKYAELMDYLRELLDFVQRTGVGAIPLPEASALRATSLQQLTEQIEKSTAIVFNQHRDLKDFGKVVNDVLAGSGR